MLSCVACKNMEESALPQAVEIQKWRVVRITRERQGQFTFLGTGLIIVRDKRPFVVTNDHVARKARAPNEATSICIAFNTNAYPARVIGSDSAHDLALLELSPDFEIDGETGETVGEVGLGTVVFTLSFDDSHSAASDLISSKGRVVLAAPFVAGKNMFIRSGVYPGEPEKGLVISGVNCTSGSSGSPVFDKHGNILGYLKGRTDDGQCIAISLERALQLISQAKTKK